MVVAKILAQLYPDATVFLNHGNPLELLIAVMLSAQSTDKQVNKVTEKLFKKYHTIDDYIRAQPKEFEKDIFSSGFYRIKTKNILATARLIKEKFNGRVPNTMEDLLTLPGVARKTANIVLQNAYGSVVGIPVDTHVRRLARLYGLTDEMDPNKIERDLMALLPQQEWKSFSYRLIQYGRDHCPARNHMHEQCPIVIALAGFTP